MLRYTELVGAMAKRYAVAIGRPAAWPDAAWPARLRNAFYVLQSYRRHCKRDDVGASVGSEFGKDFKQKSSEWLEGFKKKGREVQTLKDKKSLLKMWFDLNVQVRPLASRTYGKALQNNEKAFSLTLADILTSNGLTYGELAERIAIPPSTLYAWLQGNTPLHQRSRSAIARLEALSGAAPGSLLSLCTSRRMASVTRSPYRQRLSDNRGQVPYLRRDDEFPESLRTEFRMLVTAKTNPLDKHRWNLRPAGEIQHQKLNWATTITRANGQVWYCATAGLNWAHVKRFLSFVSLPGQDAVSVESLSLAHLTLTGPVERYLRFIAERSGGSMHAGCETFIALLVHLLRPTVGYLYQRAELASKVGVSKEDWPRHCELAFARFREVKVGVRDGSTKSRDPFVEIQHITSLPDPLAFCLDALARMKADAYRCEPGSIAQAIAVRNWALAALLLSNPLRARQVAEMRWRADGSGNLYRTSSGYGIRFDAKSFKNFKGAKRSATYDMKLSKVASEPMHEYITTYRPILLTVRNLDASPEHPLIEHSERVFVSAKAGDSAYGSEAVSSPRAVPWSGLNRAVEKFTRAYFGNNFGPHAFRDLVATIYLKKNPNGFLTVSHLLHDRLDTVMKHYANLAVSDGFAVFNDLLETAG